MDEITKRFAKLLMVMDAPYPAGEVREKPLIKQVSLMTEAAVREIKKTERLNENDTALLREYHTKLYKQLLVEPIIIRNYRMRDSSSPWSMRLLWYSAVMQLRALVAIRSHVMVESNIMREKMIKDGLLIQTSFPISEWTQLDVSEALVLLEINWRSLKPDHLLWQYIECLEERLAILSCLILPSSGPNAPMNQDSVEIDKDNGATSDELLSIWMETMIDMRKACYATTGLLSSIRGLNIRKGDFAHSSVYSANAKSGFWRWFRDCSELANGDSIKRAHAYMMQHLIRPGEHARYDKTNLGRTTLDYEAILISTRPQYSSANIRDIALKTTHAIPCHAANMLALKQFDNICASQGSCESGVWESSVVSREADLVERGKDLSISNWAHIVLIAGSIIVMTDTEIVKCEDIAEAIFSWCSFMNNDYSKRSRMVSIDESGLLRPAAIAMYAGLLKIWTNESAITENVSLPSAQFLIV